MLIRIIVSLLYLGILIFFAGRARRRTHDIEDYYVGGRNVPTIIVVLSFYATFVSTNSFVGHSAKSYIYGASWLIVGLILVLLTAFSWLVIAPRFRQKAEALGSVVPSDFFRLHFGSAAAGAVAAAIILFDSVFFLAAVLLGASESLGALLGIPFVCALAVVFGVQLTYTAVGGYLADVWSDSLQAVILFVGAVAVPAALVIGAGGWDAMSTKLQVIDSARMESGEAGFSLIRITMAAPLLLIVGIGLSGGLKLVADPRQLSRFYALREASAARRGALLIVGLIAVTYLFLLPIGLFARVYDIPIEITDRSDAIVPWLLAEAAILGPTFGAIILTALLAAAMSTIDSVLLVAAGSLQRDILPLFRRKVARDTVGMARKLVFAYAVLPLALAALAHSYTGGGLGIVELTVFAGALYAAAFLPGLVGILFWKRSSATGAILGMVVGVVSTAMWRFAVAPLSPALAVLPEVFVGVAFGTIAFVAGSIYRPPGLRSSRS
jgi:SSS family transporter